jgi:hypothetical protein
MPPKGKTDWAYGNYLALVESEWKKQLQEIVRRPVSVEALMPGEAGPDWNSMVRCFGVRLWSRVEENSNPKPLLILKRANMEGYDVLADGAVVGRIFESATAPADLTCPRDFGPLIT